MVCTMANNLFLPLFIAHVVHHSSPLGWFVFISFLVIATIVFYTIVAIYEHTQKRQAIDRISRLDLDPIKEYVNREFEMMKFALNSMGDPQATVIGHVIREYGLTEEEYDSGQPTLVIIGGPPPWEQSSRAVRNSLSIHRPDLLSAFDEVTSKRRAVYTFFGSPATLFPTIKFPTRLRNNPEGRASAYWDHVHRLMTVPVGDDLGQINETRRRLAPDFSKSVAGYQAAYYRFIDASGRSKSMPQSPPPPLAPGECVCPTCHAYYKPTDYQSDAPLWLCSTCRQPLPKE